MIDRNGQLSGSVIKCLHLSGFGREQGYGRLNPPAIDSSSNKRYISEEKLCFLNPDGRNRAAGNCLCSLGGRQPGEQLCCLPPPRSQPRLAGNFPSSSSKAFKGFEGIRESAKEFAVVAACSPARGCWPKGWCGSGCAMLKASRHRGDSQPAGLWQAAKGVTP